MFSQKKKKHFNPFMKPLLVIPQNGGHDRKRLFAVQCVYCALTRKLLRDL